MNKDLAPIRRLVLATALAVAACALLPGLAAATPLSPSPTSLDFFQGVVGATSGSQTVAVANPDPGTGQVTAVAIAGSDAGDFVVSGESCAGATIGQGSSCQVEVAFAPQSSGAKAAILRIEVEGEPAILVPLAGTGVTKVLTVPAAAAFPTTTVGEKATEQIALRNESETGLTISDAKIEGLDAGDYALEGPGCDLQLEPGQSCSLTVAFEPSGIGPREAVLAISSDAVAPVLYTELSGQGAVPELTFEPSSYDFGLVETHSGGPQTSLTLRNTGAAAVQLANPEITGPDANEFWVAGNSCSGTMLSPGATCSIQVQFNDNGEGSFSAAVRVPTANAGASFEAPLTASAERPQITASPAPLAFGPVSVGASQTREVTLTNTGNLPVGFYIAIVSGGDVSSFHLLEESCTSNLFTGHPRIFEAGESCTARIRFEPTSAGAKAATATFFGNGEGGLQVPLEGTGIEPQLSLSPSSHDFGAVAAGSLGPTQTFELRNESADPYEVDSATLAGADRGEFAIRSDECTEAVLGAGEACAVSVRFEPESTGARAATLRFRGAAGAIVARLSGEARAPAEADARSDAPPAFSGRVVFSFARHPRPATNGRVTIGRARCESAQTCVVVIEGRAGGRAAGARPIRIRPGVSAPIVVQMPASQRSSSTAATVSVTLRWRTGPEHGRARRSFPLAASPMS
ncbi:MAG TPA: choice-of-anchor D domain-containing protein [Solirubrobacterales bacterium]|jgi:hypothetical protein